MQRQLEMIGRFMSCWPRWSTKRGFSLPPIPLPEVGDSATTSRRPEIRSRSETPRDGSPNACRRPGLQRAARSARVDRPVRSGAGAPVGAFVRQAVAGRGFVADPCPETALKPTPTAKGFTPAGSMEPGSCGSPRSGGRGRRLPEAVHRMDPERRHREDGDCGGARLRAPDGRAWGAVAPVLDLNPVRARRTAPRFAESSPDAHGLRKRDRSRGAARGRARRAGERAIPPGRGCRLTRRSRQAAAGAP